MCCAPQRARAPTAPPRQQTPPCWPGSATCSTGWQRPAPRTGAACRQQHQQKPPLAPMAAPRTAAAAAVAAAAAAAAGQQVQLPCTAPRSGRRWRWRRPARTRLRLLRRCGPRGAWTAQSRCQHPPPTAGPPSWRQRRPPAACSWSLPTCAWWPTVPTALMQRTWGCCWTVRCMWQCAASWRQAVPPAAAAAAAVAVAVASQQGQQQQGQQGQQRPSCA